MSTDNDLTALRARCGPHLARLALLAASPSGTALPAWAAAEVASAAGAVLAEAGEAVSAAAAGRQATTGEFLTARLARLKAAADYAIAAARGGDAGALRACLRQFDALTSALWTVHEAVGAPDPPEPHAQVPGPRLAGKARLTGLGNASRLSMLLVES